MISGCVDRAHFKSLTRKPRGFMQSWNLSHISFLMRLWCHYMDFQDYDVITLPPIDLSIWVSSVFNSKVLTLGAFGCSSFVINSCELWLLFSSDSFQYCCWLFTDVDFFHEQNVIIILNWCLCDFLELKHIDELYTLHLHWLFTDVNIFLYSILLLIIYWCSLFFMCKMFLSFSIYVYVNLLYWNLSINGTHFIFIDHLLMLINC